VARCHASFMPLAFTQTTAPSSRPALVTLAPRRRSGRPFLGTQSVAGFVSPSALVTLMMPR
jgi:hypothetical protein